MAPGAGQRLGAENPASASFLVSWLCSAALPWSRALAGSGTAGHLMVMADPQASIPGLAAQLAAGKALGPCSAKNRRLCVN